MLIYGVRPSKKFFINATIILLIAGGVFAIAEVKRSRVVFDSGPLVVQKQETVELTNEEVDRYIDQVLREMSLDVVNKKRTETLQEYIQQPEEEEESFRFVHSELLLSRDSGEESLRVYGKSIAGILSNLFPLEYEYEGDIYSRILEEQNGVLVGVLEERRQIYLEGALDIMEVTTPPSAALHSLGMANTLLQMADGLRDMELVFSDPSKSIIGLTFFQSQLQSFYDSIDALNEYFQAREIVQLDDERVEE
ncbi:MAG: hypothetical protein Q8P93_04445 [bacterium]|nr:hypothetical protein [bacterium]